MRPTRPKLVTFSGIDGAGKTTQIEALQSNLWELGLRFRIYTFWDDVVVLSRFREQVSRSAFKGDEGIGSPEKPINRRDKNVSSWYVIAARLLLYLLDAISLCLFVKKIPRKNIDFVIFDRYIYDELANLPLRNILMRAYVSAIIWLVPRPDAAYLIDADPDVARARKPEYPVDFLRKNRGTYLTLSHLAPPMQVIGPGTAGEMSRAIMQSLSAQPVPECAVEKLQSVTMRLETAPQRAGADLQRPYSAPYRPAKISNN